MTRRIIIVDPIPLKPAPGSDIILGIGYRANTETLRVKYNNGRIFDYVGVEIENWDKINLNLIKIDALVLDISTEFQSVQVFEK